MTCPSCGASNPARARFCATCGSPLAAGRRRGVRKVVTVVVCDVTGSTALGERLDPESLGRVMAGWFERMRAVVERHHGSVQKFIGDAVVAAFGVPVVREDDALCAQGRDDEALHFAEQSGELAFRDDLYAQVERRGPLATVLARRGRRQEAERLAAEAVAMARRSDMLTMQANALLDHAGVLRLGGAAERAAPLLREAEALAERKGNLVARDQARELLTGVHA